LLRYHASMPAPFNERQALERERAELPGQLARYQRELDATPQEQRERRERLTWQIRRVQQRMAEVEARLAPIGQVSVPLGRTKHESTGGAITSRSLDEASSWKGVGCFMQECLVVRLTTAKRMEADGLRGEIHVAANEPMRP